MGSFQFTFPTYCTSSVVWMVEGKWDATPYHTAKWDAEGSPDYPNLVQWFHPCSDVTKLKADFFQPKDATPTLTTLTTKPEGLSDSKLKIPNRQASSKLPKIPLTKPKQTILSDSPIRGKAPRSPPAGAVAAVPGSPAGPSWAPLKRGWNKRWGGRRDIQ